ncbi:MAG: hypothetical protein K6B43_12895 [Treponema sp.]|nr:hypothetical protein [Treponema sp.]
MAKQNPSDKESSAYFVSSDIPAWIDKSTVAKFSDKDFQRIISFFVFLSPCKSLSARADFSEFYRWSAPWKKPYKLNEQLKKASSNPHLLFSAKNYGAMESALEKSGLKDNFPNDMLGKVRKNSPPA